VTASKPDLRAAASALNSGAIHLLRSLREVDREAGLTPARLSALSVLVFGGPCTLGALAAAEGVAGPTMTRIVDGLIAEGLAERRPHASDGRAVLVAATTAGETLMRAAQQRRIDVLAAGLANLPVSARRQMVSSAPLLDELAAGVRAQSASRASGEPSAGKGEGSSPGSGLGRRHGRAPGARAPLPPAHRRAADTQARREAARVRWAEVADQLSAAARRAPGS
jgi:DNA-binding MarR family transcriptional regulator